MAIVRTVLGGSAFSCAVLTTCVAFSRGTLVVASALRFLAAPLAAAALILAAASDMCTYTGGDFDIECALGPMSYVVLLGAAFWIGAGVSFLFAKRHERAAEDRGGAIAPIGPPAGQNKSEVKEHSHCESATNV
jgi:hypothetical protein